MSTIAVDLDGTLAHYDHWRGIEHIGAPIPAMLEKVRKWLAEGNTVVIFTARITPFPGQARDTELAKNYVTLWLARQGLPPLEVTNIKRQDFAVFYDDRAVQVRPNEGTTIGERWREHLEKETALATGLARHAFADGDKESAQFHDGMRTGLILANVALTDAV